MQFLSPSRPSHTQASENLQMEIDVRTNLKTQINQGVVFEISNIHDWLTTATTFGSYLGLVEIIDRVKNTQLNEVLSISLFSFLVK